MRNTPFHVVENTAAPLGGVPRQAHEASERFLTRLPILDAHGQLIGHELQVRERVPVPVIPGAESTHQARDEMLLVSVIDMAHRDILDNRQTFLSIEAETLFNPLVEQLPRSRVVLAANFKAPPSHQLHERCRNLAEQGIVLALDDCGVAPDDALLPYCQYVRLDVNAYDALGLGTRLDRLLVSGGPQLIAIGVETEEAYEACQRLPFKHFQGWHFVCMRPNAPHRLDASRIRVMELLNLVMSEVEIPKLEEQFKCDAGLSYKLLRFINSPAIGLRQPVRSIAHALVILGHIQLYRWLTLLLFAGHAIEPRSRALLRNAVIRARLTENLGGDRLGSEKRGGLFIAGVLSLLDVLLNLPMNEAIANLNLPEPVRSALIQEEGPYAPFLQLAIACEHFDQDVIARYAEETGLKAEEINLAHANALIWSEELDF